MQLASRGNSVRISFYVHATTICIATYMFHTIPKPFNLPPLTMSGEPWRYLVNFKPSIPLQFFSVNDLDFRESRANKHLIPDREYL